jgi:hypothetical protein
MADDEADARALWEDFERGLKRRGWYLSVGCGTVSVHLPGKGGPETDRYIEVVDG